MSMPPGKIGAAFRVERRLQLGNPPAEPGYHLGDDVIRADAQPFAGDLDGQMPVAEMPCNPQQIRRLASGDLADRLGGGANADIAAAFELQAVAVDQVMRAGQIEQIALPGSGDEADAPAVPVIIGEGYRVKRRLLRPCPPSMHCDRPPHPSSQ